MVIVRKLSIILPKENASVSSVIAYGKNVKNGLTDNATTFPDPEPTLVQLGTALTELEASIPPADEKNTVSTNLMQKLKKDFIKNMLSPIADYVLLVANGDRFTAGLSGCKLNKEERLPVVQGPISGTYVSAGAEDGTANIRITDRGNNDFFVFSLKVGDNWVVLDAFGLVDILVKGLPSGSSIIRIVGKKSDVPGTPIELVVKAV